MKTTAKTKRRTAQAAIEAQAREVLAALARLATMLPLEGVTLADAKAARAGNRVPDAVIQTAASVLEQSPERFPNFDPAVLRDALARQQAFAPVVRELTRLSQRLARTLHRGRGTAAREALALYQMLGGMARLGKGRIFAEERERMRRALTTKPKTRATTVTKKELAQATSARRKKKVAAAARAKLERLQQEIDGERAPSAR